MDGGFEVPRSPAGSSAVLRRHRFVFWPRTRSPLLVISNSSRHQPATVGRVTVYRGPAKMDDSALPVSGYGERRIFAPVPRKATGAQAGGEGDVGQPADGFAGTMICGRPPSVSRASKSPVWRLMSMLAGRVFGSPT